MLLQVLWVFPAATLGTFLLIGQDNMNRPVPVLLFGAVICGPALAAIGVGIRLLRNRRRETKGRAVATAVAVLLAIAFIATILWHSIQHLLHPNLLRYF